MRPSYGVLVAALVLYFDAGFGWLLLLVLFLVPDVSFARYAFGPRVGALAYDTLHTELLPVASGLSAPWPGSTERPRSP